VPAAADALGVVRLGAAGLLPGALLRPACRWLPAALFAVAAATDFFDGVLARRGGGPTRHGAVLDNLADIAFVLAGTITGAALGLVPSAVPPPSRSPSRPTCSRRSAEDVQHGARSGTRRGC